MDGYIKIVSVLSCAYDEEIRTVLPEVVHAGKMCIDIRQSEDLLATNKSDESPVTSADLCSQILLVNAIKSRYSGDPILAEESLENISKEMKDKVSKRVGSFINGWEKCLCLDPVPQDAKRYWAIDPVDGTKGYIRGDQFCVCAALLVENQVQFGIVYCPSTLSSSGNELGCLFIAVKGKGAYEVSSDQLLKLGNGIPKVTLKGQKLCESYVSLHSSHRDGARIIERFGLDRTPIRVDGQVKYGLIARGDAAIYYRRPQIQDYIEKIWDHAAGSLLVQESGGCVTDLKGFPLQFKPQAHLETSGGGIIASNGDCHNGIIDFINKI